MTISTNDLAPQLRRVINDTRKLYQESSKWMVSHHPDLLGDQVGQFGELMEDLHRGLLIKCYAMVIRADGQWSRMEKIVGAILIEHLWGAKLTGSDLREAAEQPREKRPFTAVLQHPRENTINIIAEIKYFKHFRINK